MDVNKTIAKQIAVRAIKTWFQAFLAVFVMESIQGMDSNSMLRYFGNCALTATISAFLSVATSIVGGIPEAKNNTEITFTPEFSNEDEPDDYVFGDDEGDG